MKKNILFSIFVTLFAFLFLTTDSNVHARICDYNKYLDSFTIKENQKFTIVSAVYRGTCMVYLKDQDGNESARYVSVSSEKCDRTALDINCTDDNICYIYDCDYENDYDSEVIYNTKTVSCGSVTGIPKNLPVFVRRLVNLIKVFVPIILIILGIVDFVKAMSSGEEKTMSESPKRFIRRIIVSVLIFLVVVVIQFVIKLISDAGTKAGSNNPAADVTDCISCFISDGKYCKDE